MWLPNMRILLDECIDRRFAREIIGYEVKTVPKMGWAGVKNGKLLVVLDSASKGQVTIVAE